MRFRIYAAESFETADKTVTAHATQTHVLKLQTGSVSGVFAPRLKPNESFRCVYTVVKTE